MQDDTYSQWRILSEIQAEQIKLPQVYQQKIFFIAETSFQKKESSLKRLNASALLF